MNLAFIFRTQAYSAHSLSEVRLIANFSMCVNLFPCSHTDGLALVHLQSPRLLLEEPHPLCCWLKGINQFNFSINDSGRPVALDWMAVLEICRIYRLPVTPAFMSQEKSMP
ncbi:hypothetical protein GOODEAATRI_031278 [Goodea atripinnis]|uniref:Uncharacterized protein n=1 Tax=Goodea atripinnis TaxID=208336 RepID=A0ABV0MZR3_9TELE